MRGNKMKITGLNVPGPLVQKFKLIVTQPKVDHDGNGTARSRRGAKRQKAGPKKEPIGKDVRDAVAFLADRIGLIKGTSEYQDFQGNQLKLIDAGIFQEAYWTKCEIIETTYLKNLPTNVPDDSPSPYSFRHGDNLPSITTYGNGTSGSGPARYEGGTNEGYFEDGLLVWSRTIYKIGRERRKNKVEPALLQLKTNIAISSSSRASKAMLSIVLRCYITDDSGTALTTTENPVAKIPPASEPNIRGCTSLYWRYRIPAGEAPYYSATVERTVVKNLPTMSTIDDIPHATRAVVTCAPRPMFGHAFNNNISINTTLDSVPDIYQIVKPAALSLFWSKPFVANVFNEPPYIQLEFNDITWKTGDVTWHSRSNGVATPGFYNYTWSVTSTIEVPLAVITVSKVSGFFQPGPNNAPWSHIARASGFQLYGDMVYDEAEGIYHYTLDYFNYDVHHDGVPDSQSNDLLSIPISITRKVFEQEIGKGRTLVSSTTVVGYPDLPVRYNVMFYAQ